MKTHHSIYSTTLIDYTCESDYFEFSDIGIKNEVFTTSKYIFNIRQTFRLFLIVALVLVT